MTLIINQLNRLDDVYILFSQRPILIPHTARLKLKRGWLQDLRRIKRNGPAKMKIGRKQLIKINFIIDRLEVK